MSRCQSLLVSSSYFFVNGLWHSSCEPAQRQYVIHDWLAAKQLQFPSAQALPAALHWQLMTFINSGGAGGPIAITGDGMLLSISQPKSVMTIAGATCLSSCCLPEHRLMVCSEHVKEQIFVRRRQRLHEWWFAFLFCVDHESDDILAGALSLAIQCCNGRLTRFQQVF